MADLGAKFQQQIIDARRTQILDAATEVFAQKGFHRATIKAIASVAGVADGTIYNYFENKTALLMGILDRLNESDSRAEDMSGLVSDGDPKGFMTAYMRHRMELLWPNLDVFRAVLPEVMTNETLRAQYYADVVQPSLRVAETLFAGAMEAGEMRPLDVELTVRALAGTFLGMLVLQLLGDDELARRADDLPDVLASLFYEGLQPGA